MKKWTLLLVILVLLTGFAAPVYAANNNKAENGKHTGKHNFEQWQTIKRLQIANESRVPIDFVTLCLLGVSPAFL